MEKPIELRSKLVDGVLAGSVLVLLELLLILLIKPVQLVFSKPGLLVYTVVLLAVSAACLERSLNTSLIELVRAWWGVLGGLAGWVVIELSNYLGSQELTSETGVLNLMLVLLVVSVLWRRIAPLGLRYYFVMVLLGWVGHSGLVSLAFLTKSIEPRLVFLIPAVGYAAAGIMALSLVYIFLRSRGQLERLNAALTLWYTTMIMIYVFRGGFG
jgi:hypothetical protein